ncbi:hypothetical protein BU17DRAFT_80462 [Hysterangium stoloniferum]|nr:hypothetical protein BU17DRAFT_80462 [Hysterangium stoloniferum]
MADEAGFADPLSYDDTPYERQVLDDSATETSLKERIGNRIYLFEDSLSKKRKRVDDDEDKAEEETSVADNADIPYRPNALLLQGPPITQMPTSRVFAYATHFDAYPIGLEWVDDQTCILVFSNRKGALHAFNALCKQTVATHGEMMGMELDGVDELLHFAHAVPLALYPIEDRINSVLGCTKKSDILKQSIQVRWARPSDVKERGARDKSEFYKKFGESAGKNVIPGSSKPVGIRNGNDEVTRSRLDAQLDSFQDGNKVFNLSLERPSSDVDARKRNEDERRRRLDHELDAFLAGGDDDLVLENVEAGQEDGELLSRPSLLERTRRTSRSRSPRRRREAKALKRPDIRSDRDNPRRQYQTDSDGRWLHNAEVAQMRRRRTDYDAEVFGMRAWDDERAVPRRKQKKARKTQDDLDRELEAFGRQESAI